MSTTEPVERDERTVFFENVSYRWGFFFLCYALLLDVAYRGFVRKEAAWDLLALVIAAGGISTAYQAMYNILSRSWVKAAVLAASVAAVIAAVLAMLH